MSTGTLTSGPLLARIEVLALVALGGFAGANCRYAVSLAVPGLGGTLLANVGGAFLLGFVLYESRYAGSLSPETRLAVSTGFLSSLTTYSTFALQSAQSPPLVLVGNVVATYALGFAAVAAGRALARRSTRGESA
ncbi:CrcB family protein [Halarchaeum nitratireducens]|uniref:Fluoride-specific ion channel FluC n=1 Tax=Halarchaeum nitratireducens TaxID=489913 RepID=A0A830G8T7_9EURY|nr:MULTISPECIES: CrcB family protein [Halarchaeum]MBP2251463.1 CrcB protein [Halarchaeum solikamskense]GGN07166.1 chromosome condensation protein CrcB [Halarchaeum nitratireducens]